MATLLTARTTNTDGTSTGSEISGGTTVWVRGVFDGATVSIQGSATTNTADFCRMDSAIIRTDVFRVPGCVKVDGTGAYRLRAELNNAGATTSITVTTTE